jgi:hypothetical protein
MDLGEGNYRLRDLLLWLMHKKSFCKGFGERNARLTQSLQGGERSLDRVANPRAVSQVCAALEALYQLGPTYANTSTHAATNKWDKPPAAIYRGKLV